MQEKKREIWKGFFALEGLDGAGTTTQLKTSELKAETQKMLFWTTAEPTPSPIGLMIRQALRHEVVFDSDTLARLFAADRQEHLFGKNGIYEHLEKHYKVLTDRYIFSSLAYQTLQVPIAQVEKYNDTFPLPEVVFFIDADTETAQKRISSRNQQVELFELPDIQVKIREGFLSSLQKAQALGTEVIILDAKLSIPELNTLIWQRIIR